MFGRIVGHRANTSNRTKCKTSVKVKLGTSVARRDLDRASKADLKGSKQAHKRDMVNNSGKYRHSDGSDWIGN
jgi:hypothetical protein